MAKRHARGFLTEILTAVVIAVFSTVPAVSFAGGMEALKGGSETSFVYRVPEGIAANFGEIPPAAENAADYAVLGTASPYYLTAGQVQIADFPPPPAAGSPEDKADLAAVLQWQKDRTPAQCAAANAQANESYAVFFGEVSPFPSPLPAAAAAFFKRVQSDSGAADRYLKELYRRPRPFQQNASVNPCLGKIGGYSYPSGHATAAHLFGLILADLAPRQSSVFAAYAAQAALNRVIGGVHYPSDVEAGKRLAGAVYTELRQNPAFVADMNALKQFLSE